MATIGEINQKEECIIEWLIKDFFSLDASYYYSPRFLFANVKWFLQIELLGDKSDNSEENIGIFLHRDTFGSPIAVDCIFGVKTIDEKLDPETGWSYIFKDKDGRGVRPLLARTEVFRRKYNTTCSDTLTFVCKIKTSKKVGNEISIFQENKFLQDYKELYLKQKDCDVTIKVEEQEFPAHKIILSARCPFFESIFRKKGKKKRTDVVNVKDVEPATFSLFLCFLYCSDTDIITEKNVFGLYNAAEEYYVSDLSESCLQFIKDNLSVDTFCDTITWALEYSETDIVTLATDFFATNGDKIIKMPEWQSFLKKYPAKSNELLIKAFECFKDIKK